MLQTAIILRDRDHLLFMRGDKDPEMGLLSRPGSYADKKERCVIGVRELRHIPMAPAEAEKGWYIQRYSRNLDSGTLLCIPVFQGSELQVLLHYTVSSFPAADILVLVAAAHVGDPPLFECIKCHGGGIMESGKKITGLVRKALPALEPERLGSQFQRPAMDKEHPAVNPLHGHVIEDGEKWGIPQLFVAVCACGIASAYEETMEVSMVMVPEDRYETVFPGQGMDLLESFLGPVTPMNEIAQIHENIDRAECFKKQRGPDTCCKCTDCH
jgi:hypothetical protein